MEEMKQLHVHLLYNKRIFAGITQGKKGVPSSFAGIPTLCRPRPLNFQAGTMRKSDIY